ncbi:MAG: peptide ABC transporter permease [Planctomycetaceae bacterium]|nr:peptide ABC transporter permease [Planctomycetaceae bacterium]
MLQLRIRRFKRIKRGYWSFWILLLTYLTTFFLPFLISNRAIVVYYEGSYYFPSTRSYLNQTFGYHKWLGLFEDRVYSPKDFGQESVSVRANYRELQQQFESAGSDNYVIMPPIPYSPTEQFLKGEEQPPNPPSAKHWLGTDDSGRDVLTRLVYGFRISITFAVLVTTASYLFGTVIGAALGYYGRWVDLAGQRIVEIISGIPFLYTVIILSSMLKPSFLLLVGIIAAFGWMGITYYIRGEFYREKAKDYVAAAIATGESGTTIMLRHILPNALTPLIAFAPFALVANILTLVALDFLGFGLPAPTPSWGELTGQGREYVQQGEWHLTVLPLLAMFFTLQLIVVIGEAVREAFDPKVFSRLR